MSLVLSSCVGLAKRPRDVAQKAVFSGGVKGGTWITCVGVGGLQNCDIRNYKGRLYEQGLFSLEPTINPCFPSYIVGDYRYQGGFLIPKTVRQIGQNIVIQKKEDNQTLQESIFIAFAQIHDIRPMVVELHVDGSCQNGFYEAKLQGNDVTQTGRIWGGSFFQIWPISTNNH